MAEKISNPGDETPFVKVWSKRTGRLHRIPRHFLGNPHLMRPFRTTEPATSGAEVSDRPSEDWTVKQLRDHAASHNVDLKGARSKADIVAAINAPQIATGDVIPNASDPTDPESVPEDSSDTGSDD